MEPPNWFFSVSGRYLAGDAVSLKLREGITRLEPVVLVELEHAAEQRVSAGLRLHGHDTGRRLAKLRVVVLRGDLRLTNRLERGVDDDDAQDRIAVLRAIELVPGAAEVLPIDHGLG